MNWNQTPLRESHPVNRPYLVINWVFAMIFAGIFIYSLLYDPDRGSHPLPSAYQLATDEESISTGLSRSFSAIMRFRLEDAREFNPYGPRVFLFFAVQFILRITLLFMLLKGKLAIDHKLPTESTLQKRRWLLLVDATQAIVLFTVCFWAFLVYWMEGITAG